MNLRVTFVFSISLLGLLCLMLPGSLRAETIYTYTGNPYTVFVNTLPSIYNSGPFGTALSVTIDVMAGTPLDSLAAGTDISARVRSFSFTDNRGLTITPANLIHGLYPSDYFYVGTDASGNITSWFVLADGNDPNCRFSPSFPHPILVSFPPPLSARHCLNCFLHG